ncbi:MAG: CBS domain-containing protein [Lactobacillus sp.]|jgi:predicted transcriptional regulator|nr:CBS domain-containing protein [Lactobacillus sp.]MCH3905640.1 CBS domain-containing protein [Lactobacillus sp.]MCH3990802.1 CBS domain-containing protein [Lactobacillus sp.]MCH4068482.1 CBS domain-containing protein [Lactobacillus sp.]MCI1304231.1 CBS domain-containing protein [Lactobacillus sp.]
MFSPALTKLIKDEPGHFLVPASRIAFVEADNPLYHAFLILTKVKYAKIPVLDHDNRVVGLISLAMITNKMLTPDNIVISPLSTLKVKDVMQTDFATLEVEDDDLETQLHLLVNNNFVPVVDRDGKFQGLITRREWIKTFNYLGHAIDGKYQLVPKQ